MILKRSGKPTGNPWEHGMGHGCPMGDF